MEDPPEHIILSEEERRQYSGDCKDVEKGRKAIESTDEAMETLRCISEKVWRLREYAAPPGTRPDYTNPIAWRKAISKDIVGDLRRIGAFLKGA